MAIKKYNFQFNCFNDVKFNVDTEKLPADLPKQFLEFSYSSCDYDEEGDLIEEALKKVALQCLHTSLVKNYNTIGVKKHVPEIEGFFDLDGSLGVELMHIDTLELDESDLERIEIE